MKKPHCTSRKSWLIRLLFFVVCLTQAVMAQTFTHPGLLHTQTDFDRMVAKVSANAQPWKAGWDRLLANPRAQLTWTYKPSDSKLDTEITELRHRAHGNQTKSGFSALRALCATSGSPLCNHSESCVSLGV